MKNQKKILFKKILATILVSIFFIYFWLEGPLQYDEILSEIETEETEFSIPKIVKKSSDKKTHGEIEDVETKGDGWQLLGKKTKKSNSQVISSRKENEKLRFESSKKLIDHIESILPGKIDLEILPIDDFFFSKINQDNKTYFYIESGHQFNHIKGYGGPINVGVLINQDGLIETVQHISSKETESYLRKILKTNYYASYNSVPIENEHTIDAVSGATLTTVAISQIVSEMVSSYSVGFIDYLNKDRAPTSFKIEAKNTFWWIVHIIVIGTLFIYGIQKKYKKSKKDIRILSLFSIIYIGFFMNNSFTYVSFLHPLLGTSLSSLITFYALFSLLGSIWGKNIYCKYVCPFGHSQRIALQLSKKRFSSKFFISNKWVKRIRDGLTIFLVTGILLGLRSWSNYEVFPDFFGVDFYSSWFFVSLIIIIANIKYPFIWCRIACPTGAILDRVTKITH